MKLWDDEAAGKRIEPEKQTQALGDTERKPQRASLRAPCLRSNVVAPKRRRVERGQADTCRGICIEERLALYYGDRKSADRGCERANEIVRREPTSWLSS